MYSFLGKLKIKGQQIFPNQLFVNEFQHARNISQSKFFLWTINVFVGEKINRFYAHSHLSACDITQKQENQITHRWTIAYRENKEKRKIHHDTYSHANKITIITRILLIYFLS